MLFEQGQEHMLCVDLGMAVAANDFIGAGGRILSTLCKTIKSHLTNFLDSRIAGNNTIPALSGAG